MKETVRALETGALAEVAIVAFVVAFLAICAYAFLMTRAQRERAKHLPLDDAMPASPTTTGGDGAATSPDDLILRQP